jgi:dipeptidyl aminopeptidase/acylaminoacyl peptidase
MDTVPRSLLRRADGKAVLELEHADLSALVATGWRYPERFSAKAADGITDIYGLIFRPSRFDPAKQYPVLDDIYPGPQTIRTPKAFSAFGVQSSSMAELGFIVVLVDGRGTPYRSKAFHDLSYGNLDQAGGLDDHIAAFRQLAQKYPSLDLNRVGIFGHSGGGFASTRAILAYPDFYKVAVSSAGNHDQRGYLALWGELYEGYPVTDAWVAQANVGLADRLKGKLLLMTGDMDDNVHPALTMQLVDALVKANKDFDLIVLPNRNHGSAGDPYFIRRRWDYFVKYLLGVEPPANYRVKGPEAAGAGAR